MFASKCALNLAMLKQILLEYYWNRADRSEHSMALVNDLFVTTTEGDFLFLLNFGITFSEKYVIKQDVFDHVCHFDFSSKCTRELLSNILP